MHWKFDIDLRSLVRAADDLSVKSAKLAFPDSYPLRVDFFRGNSPYVFTGQFKATVKPVNQQTSSLPLALMEVAVTNSSTAQGVLSLSTTSVQDFVRPYGERPVALELLAVSSGPSGGEIASWTVNCELSRRYTETGVVVIDLPSLKATKTEAELGINDTKWMTPVRVWDAIRKWADVNFVGHKHTNPADIKDALAASGIEIVEGP